LYAPEDVPFIIGPHAMTWPTPDRSLRFGDIIRAAMAPLFSFIHRRALSRAAVLLIATPEASSIFPDAFGVKTRLLPFGIDDSALFPTTDPPQEPTIVFVGGLEQRKGVLKLVEAFALVREEVPAAKLVVAGEGPERAALEERSRQLRLDGSIRLLGLVPHDRIPELLRSSDVACLPSDGEPFGMAVLEAMAAGRPVVTLNRGGPRFLLSHDRGEQLVAGNDADSLAEALARLLRDDERLVQIGRENRERVESTFTLSRVIDELESIYEGVL
jgi:glycosyltransferase involved in cell wall biosynthesis